MLIKANLVQTMRQRLAPYSILGRRVHYMLTLMLASCVLTSTTFRHLCPSNQTPPLPRAGLLWPAVPRAVRDGQPRRARLDSFRNRAPTGRVSVLVCAIVPHGCVCCLPSTLAPLPACDLILSIGPLHTAVLSPPACSFHRLSFALSSFPIVTACFYLSIGYMLALSILWWSAQFLVEIFIRYVSWFVELLFDFYISSVLFPSCLSMYSKV